MPSLSDFPLGKSVQLLDVFRNYPDLTTPERVSFIGLLYKWESEGLVKVSGHPILLWSLRVNRLR